MKNICKICNKKFNQLQNRNRNRCNACNTKIRRFRNKQRAIELLGGKCQRCGYNKHQSALEFHHKDPKEKDFAIGMVGNKSWESIVNEIKKCELLCSNCHRIEHSNRDGIIFLEEVLKYKGKIAEMD
jgi:DNA-directed RNA polymerase subunit RPC12/RpoP